MTYSPYSTYSISIIMHTMYRLFLIFFCITENGEDLSINPLGRTVLDIIAEINTRTKQL